MKIKVTDKGIVQVWWGFGVIFLFFCTQISTKMNRQLHTGATTRRKAQSGGSQEDCRKTKRTTRQNSRHAKLQKKKMKKVLYPLVLNESHYGRK